MRWPTKLLSLSQPLMAEQCVPAGGNGVLSRGRVLRLTPYWGTLRAVAIAPSQTGRSPRAGVHLHQSGGSPGARRGQRAISSLRPAAQTRGSWGWGFSVPLSSAPHHSEGPGAGDSAREPLEFGEAEPLTACTKPSPDHAMPGGWGSDFPFLCPFTPNLLPLILATLASSSLLFSSFF